MTITTSTVSGGDEEEAKGASEERIEWYCCNDVLGCNKERAISE
jgi:hypothetical protein